MSFKSIKCNNFNATQAYTRDIEEIHLTLYSTLFKFQMEPRIYVYINECL